MGLWRCGWGWWANYTRERNPRAKGVSASGGGLECAERCPGEARGRVWARRLCRGVTYSTEGGPQTETLAVRGSSALLLWLESE